MNKFVIATLHRKHAISCDSYWCDTTHVDIYETCMTDTQQSTHLHQHFVLLIRSFQTFYQLFPFLLLIVQLLLQFLQDFLLFSSLLFLKTRTVVLNKYTGIKSFVPMDNSFAHFKKPLRLCSHTGRRASQVT